MRQPLYGEHNYTHELNIRVRSLDRISAHASASLWRAQLHTHELNIQVRSCGGSGFLRNLNVSYTATGSAYPSMSM